MGNITSGGQLAPSKFADAGDRFAYADVTGDGIVGLVWYHHDGTASVPIVRPGDGRGNFACLPAANPSTDGGPACSRDGFDPAWVSSGYALSVVGGAPTPWAFNHPKPYVTYFHDVTGDGLADIISYDAGGPGHWNHDAFNKKTNFVWSGDGLVRLWVNLDGRRFQCAAPGSDCVVGKIQNTLGNGGGPTGDVHLDYSKISFADMDANGVDDLVVAHFSGLYVFPLVQTPARGDAPRSPKPGLLTQINNGRGATTKTAYATVQELDAVAQQSGSAWKTHLPVVVPVVERVTTADTATLNSQPTPPVATFARGKSFVYRDPAYDPWLHRFQGFGSVTRQTDGRSDVFTTTYWYSPCLYDVTPSSVPCTATSDDDPYRPFWGFPVRVDHYVPGFPSRGYAGQWLRSTSTTPLDHTGGRSLMKGGAHDGRSVRDMGQNLWRQETIYDANVATSGAYSQIMPDGHLDPAGPPTQTGAQILHHVSYRDTTGLLFKAEEYAAGTSFGVLPASSALRRVRSITAPVDSHWIGAPTQITTTLPNADSHLRAVDTARTVNIAYDGPFPRSVTAKSAGGVVLTRAQSIGTPSPRPDNTVVELAHMDHDELGNVILASQAGIAGARKMLYSENYKHLPTLVQELLPSGAYTAGTILTYHRGFGALTGVVDLNTNHVLELVGLDGFGRPVTRWEGVGDGVNWTQVASMDYSDTGPIAWSRIQITTGSNVQTSFVLRNGLGESLAQLANANPSDPGPWVVSGERWRALDGAVTAVTRPWFLAVSDPVAGLAAGTIPLNPGASTTARAYYRDQFDRVVKVVDGVNVLGDTEYHPLRVRYRDGNEYASSPVAIGSRYQEDTFDSLGFLTKHVKAETAETKTTAFVRNIDGSPVYTRDSHSGGTDSVSRTVYYDSLGHMVQNGRVSRSASGATASDLGASWKYTWDGFRLTGTSDPRGCGENLFYDTVGRLLAEDYSPCTSEFIYTAPDVATGDGTEVFYRYDTYESGQIASEPGFTEDAAAFAIGRLVSVSTRGAHEMFNYDGRGRIRRATRQLAKPDSSSPVLAERYTARKFDVLSQYDNVDRSTIRRARAYDVHSVNNGEVDESTTYDARGMVRSTASSIGNVIADASYDADGLVRSVTYGDVAATEAFFDYDSMRNLKHYSLVRSQPNAWLSSPSPTTYSVSVHGLFGSVSEI
jgi:hypothetical protein